MRFGYPLVVVVLFLAHPVPTSIAWGAMVGVVGLVIRALAAGFLHKQQVLTVKGPYAHTRNPLYLGSAVLTLGAAIATFSWIDAVLLCVYFAVFYSVVMRREEAELRLQHGAAFDEYAREVPLFFPRWSAARLPGAVSGSFSLAQYVKNREFRAAVGFLFLLGILVVIWRLRLP